MLELYCMSSIEHLVDDVCIQNAKFKLAIETVRKGLLTNLTPETARKIAYQNAQRLFALKGAPGP